MPNDLRLRIVQMNSAASHHANIAAMQAAAQKPGNFDMLILPEVSGLMNRKAQPGDIVAADEDKYIAACRETAHKRQIWINTGSTPVRGPGDLNLNHGDLIDRAGQIVASYDKIHLFDVAIEGRAPIGESKRFTPGAQAVVADTPWGALGLTICYDLRFPALYRSLAQAGARVIFVPSAFTVPTGQAHWEPLLRARAIENGCWIVAAAQTGLHEDGRETYGHSLVIDPWGKVVLDLRTAPGSADVTIDLSLSDKARQQIPSLTHDRAYTVCRTGPSSLMPE